MCTVRGDITRIPVDAIVNAADPSLLGGHGVDGAIHRAAGPALLDECRQTVAERGESTPGDAVVTGAGELPASCVIHVVAPIWAEWKRWDGEADKQLSLCYRNAIELAISLDIQTISFPNIGTGHYGFPKERAAELAVLTTLDAMDSAHSIEEVLFVCFDEDNAAIYELQLEQSPL